MSEWKLLEKMMLGSAVTLREQTDCAHERQKYQRGAWFCTECGKKVS